MRVLAIWMCLSMVNALNAVPDECSAEVSRLCHRDESFLMTVQSDPLLMSDPWFQMVFMTEPTIVTIEDNNSFAMMLDEMLESVLRMSSDVSPPDRTLDVFLAPWISDDTLVQKMSQHGQAILETEQDDDRRRLARRLTELPQQRTSDHDCLWKAFHERRLSSSCELALVQHRRPCFATLLASTTIALVAVFILRSVFRRRRFGLRRRVLQAVYNDPALRAAVENAVGQDIGSPPPSHIACCDRFFYSLPLLCLSLLLLFTAVTAPDVVILCGLPTLLLVFTYKIIKFCFCRRPVAPYPGNTVKNNSHDIQQAYVGVPLRVV